MPSSGNNNENELFAGLKARNFDKISIQYICALCKLILLHPWQLLCCGILLCRWCLKKGLPDSEPFICQFCHTKQIKKEALADRGVEREMTAIIILCYSCPWEGLYKDYLNHLQELHAYLECIDCHEHFFAINPFEEHRQELCIHRCLPCGLPNCSDSIKWYDMQAHYLSEQHQYTLLIFVSKYADPNYQRSQIEKHFQAIQKEFHDIEESIKLALSACQILSNDAARLKTEESQIQTNLEQNVTKLDELKIQYNENEENAKELLNNQNHTQIELNNMKESRENNEILTLDMNSTATLRFDTPNIPSFSINSWKFKTSHYGYTFMLRVCSTIEFKQEYLSIFLTLYDGEYSNLIPYPFSYNIHFTLWDQSNQEKHIKYVLKPDINSSSFARPTTENNDEYGVIKFCPLEFITDTQSIYVKDGSFFIRIFIDFLNTGKNPFHFRDNTDDIELMVATTATTENI